MKAQSQSVVWLAWYISGVFVILAVLVSLITFHPRVQWLAPVLLAAFSGAAMVAAGLALTLSRLSPPHWLHHSKPLQVSLVVAATAVTLLVLLVG